MLEQIQGYDIEVFIVRIIIALWFGYMCVKQIIFYRKVKDFKAYMTYLMFLITTISFTYKTFSFIEI